MQGKKQKDAGVDAVLFCPPNMIAWDPNTAEDLLLEHVKRFDKQVESADHYVRWPHL